MRALLRLVAALCALALPAGAQTVCLGYADLAAMLAGQFGMERHLVAIETPELMGELWLNPDGTGWTWVERSPAGWACMVLAGPAWMPAKVVPKPGVPS